MKNLIPFLTHLTLQTLLTILSQLPTLNAQWPTTPDSGLVVGYGDFPSIVSDDDGGAIVAFRANNPSQIKVKRVDKYGYQQWNGFSGVVAGGIADWQDYSDIAEDGRGGVLVSFQDIDCYTDCYLPWMTYSSYVTVNRIDHLGNKLWGEGVRVTVHDTIIQSNAQVRSDAHAGAVVSWLQNGYIYVQRIDSTGNRIWSDTGMVVGASTYKPGMLVNENGDTFVFFWDGSTYRMQKLNLVGQKLWTESGIAVTQVPWNLAISDKAGGVIVGGALSSVWLQKLSCQYIDSSGQELWGSGGVLLVDSVNAQYSQVSGLLLDLSQSIYVSFYHNKAGQSYVFLQRINADGQKLFGSTGIWPSSDSSSKIAGGFVHYRDSVLYAWNDARSGTFCQKLDSSGNRAWIEDKHISQRGIDGFTDDRMGGVIKYKYSSPDFSINLSKISKNGNVGEVLTALRESRSHDKKRQDFFLNENYPNPFNNSTTITYEVFSSSHVQLSIYNVLGQKLMTLTDRYLQSGKYAVNLDMSSYSSGVYLYRLSSHGKRQTRKFLFVK